MLIKKYKEYNIDLTTKSDTGMTAFHFSCSGGHTYVAEMLIQKSVKLNLDLTTRDQNGQIGFHLACL